MRLRNTLVLAGCLFLMVAAQLLWKIGRGQIGGLDLQGAGVVGQLLAVICAGIFIVAQSA